VGSINLKTISIHGASGFPVLEANYVKQMRQLSRDNGRLEKLLAKRNLEIGVMKEIVAKKR
jgi:hypothetical protein